MIQNFMELIISIKLMTTMMIYTHRKIMVNCCYCYMEVLFIETYFFSLFVYDAHILCSSSGDLAALSGSCCLSLVLFTSFFLYSSKLCKNIYFLNTFKNTELCFLCDDGRTYIFSRSHYTN